MKMEDDVELLKAQTRELARRLEFAESASTKLQNNLIRQAINRNEVFKTRVLDYDGVADKLYSSFKVEFANDIPRVVSKEKVVSHRHGYTNEPDAVIAELLETKFKEFLLPEQADNGTAPGSGGEVASNKPDDGALEKFKDAYFAARQSGDTTAMVGIKRKLAEAGFANALM
jgi:hypothetical protein